MLARAVRAVVDGSIYLLMALIYTGKTFKPENIPAELLKVLVTELCLTFFANYICFSLIYIIYKTKN
jgi:hypothetical protein